jgi:hypothetical protein
VISADTLALWQNTAQGPQNATSGGESDAPKPMEFWWYVLIAVLALAIAESLLGNHHLTVDSEAGSKPAAAS